MTKKERAGSADDAGLLELFDLLGRRWVLRMLWELRDSPLTYRELASRIPEMSTSMLTYRLRDLRAADLVGHAGHGYELSPSGRDLVGHVEGLQTWVDRADFSGRSADRS